MNQIVEISGWKNEFALQQDFCLSMPELAVGQFFRDQKELFQDVMERLLRKGASVTIFSDKDVSCAGRLSSDILSETNAKITSYLSLRDNWNGPDTKAPEGPAGSMALKMVDAYDSFLQNYSVTPASIQVYPLNNGGIALELITLSFDLVLQFLNENRDPNNIPFFLTNDIDIEEEGSISMQALDNLFSRLID